MKVLEHVKSTVQKLKKKRRKPPSRILSSPRIKACLADLQKKFVFVQTDKASNNIAIVCKKFYVEKSMQELKIFLANQHKKIDGNTYVEANESTCAIIKRHMRYMKSNLSMDDIPEKLPFLYWIPKMHKKPYSKQRYIAASACCSTKPLSAVLTKCLKLVQKQHRILCHRYDNNYGINPMWIIDNSNAVHKNIAKLNHKKRCDNIRTYDFSTLYTNIPHKQLKAKLAWVVSTAFKSSKRSFISVYKHGARWVNSPNKNTLSMDCRKVIRLINWLVDNIYVTFGDKCFRQTIGIPMGTDCAPFLANLFLFAYEYQWIDKQRRLNHQLRLSRFKYCSRYIDDLLMINNCNFMIKAMTEIYPKELVLVPEENDGLQSPFLDLDLSINNGIISTKIFDKRDAFDFPIVNFPNLSGNIPDKSSYGVFVGELVRYARACTHYNDFAEKTLSLVKKLKSQLFRGKMLKRAWSSFCNSHLLLIQKFGPKILDLHNQW